MFAINQQLLGSMLYLRLQIVIYLYICFTKQNYQNIFSDIEDLQDSLSDKIFNLQATERVFIR